MMKKGLEQIIKTIVMFLKAVKSSFSPETDRDKVGKTNTKVLTAVAYSVLALIVVVAVTCGAIANVFLGKINYGDIKGTVSETLDEEEKIDFDIEETKTVNNTDKKDTKKKDKEKTTVEDRIIINKKAEVIPENEGYRKVKTSEKIEENANNDIEKNTSKVDDVWYSDDVYNLLIVGYDAGDAEKVMFEGATLPRSDAIMIASINKVKRTVKLVSLSRATYVGIPGHGNKRLNTAHAYGGATMLRETIETNYKIRIDNFVSVDFSGFKTIIDALGGISVGMTKEEAQFTFETDDIEKGMHLMNGRQALRYVRLREIDSDRARTGRQRRVLKNTFYKARNMSLSQILSFFNVTLPYINTDLSKTEIVDKATEMQNCLSWEWKEDIIPHEAIQLTMRDGKEVIILDWKQTVNYVHSILYENVKVKKTSVR